MKKIFLIIIFVLSGCSSLTVEEIASKCGLEGNWAPIELEAGVQNFLLSMVDEYGSVRENLSESFGKTKDIWLKNGIEIAVCRYNPRQRCSGVTPFAVFSERQGDFKIKEKALIVCWRH